MISKKDMLLLLLMEECSEVTQSCSKALRFGIDHGENKKNLIQELVDLETVLCLLIEEDILPLDYVSSESYNKKRDKIDHYLEISKTLGKLKE